MNKEQREMHRKMMLGKNNPRWNNNHSEYPNHIEFKRKRIETFKRSKGKCEICNGKAKLVHHIDGDKGNHFLDNLIALCRSCHESLHCDSLGKSNGGRPNKYPLEFGLSIKEIAKKFGVVPGTVYYWLGIPHKRKWLKEQLEVK